MCLRNQSGQELRGHCWHLPSSECCMASRDRKVESGYRGVCLCRLGPVLCVMIQLRKQWFLFDPPNSLWCPYVVQKTSGKEKSKGKCSAFMEFIW